MVRRRREAGTLHDERGKVSRVEIRLRAIETGTELTLVHARLSGDDSVRNHEAGWDGALEKLIRRFSGGAEVSFT